MTVIETESKETKSLAELQAEQRSAARGDFCRQVWEGGSPAELAALANTAALEGDQADRLCAQIENARKQVSLAADLPKLEKANLVAEAKAAQLTGRADQLQTEADDLYAEATGLIKSARAGVAEASRASMSLRGQHGRDPVAVPATRLPPAVVKAIKRERDGQEEQRQDADRRTRSERIKQLEAALAARKAAETTPMRVRTPAGIAYAREGIDDLEAQIEAIKSKR